MRFIAALIALALPCFGQVATLHVTGQVQSRRTTEFNFGRLPKGYRAADWVISNESPVAVKFALARIQQQIKVGNGVSILSRVSSISVVQDAQSSSPESLIGRIGLGLVGGSAAAKVAGIIPATGWGNYAVLGSGGLALLIQYILPVVKSHAVLSISGMMPDPIKLDPFETLPGMIIVELGKKTPDPPRLDVTVSIPTGEK